MSSTIDGVDRLLARRALELFRSTLAWLDQDVSAIPVLDETTRDALVAMRVQIGQLRTQAALIQNTLDEPAAVPQLGDLIEKIIFEKGEGDAEVE